MTTFQSTTLVSDTDVEDAETTLATLDKAASLKPETERPDWLPEGIDSVEDLMNDYNALKNGTPEDADADDDTDPEPESEGDGDPEEEGEDSPDDGGDLDLNALHAEYFETGGLSDESIASLEAIGIPRSYVDAYIQGYEARTQLAEMQAAEVVGGKENLQAVLQWAGSSLPDSEIDRINRLVETGDMEGYLTTLHGLKARYESSNGSLDAPTLIGSNGGVTADIYASAEEMKADMRDPRYAADEAFRARVAAKVARTRRAG